MVEVELWHILVAIAGGFSSIYARLEFVCKSVEKLKALARITHPEESKRLKL